METGHLLYDMSVCMPVADGKGEYYSGPSPYGTHFGYPTRDLDWLCVYIMVFATYGVP